jgi:hypothetical protein
MGRFLVIVAAVSALAGCYNPRYPSERPAAEPQGPEMGTYDWQGTNARERRDGAAGSGSSTPGY